jgi:hypothetical protein
MSKAIPDDVRLFVRTHLRSMFELEALLLLAREPERWWNAETVDRQLRASREAVTVQLERLAAAGLLEVQAENERRFRFSPRVSEHVPLVAALIALHRDRFHAVVDLVYGRDRAQEFADAFKITRAKDDENG